MEATFVVVGGGIAGVTCAETLAFLEPNEKIILVSESSLIKTVTNLYAITRTLSHFDIEEKSTDFLSSKHLNITVIHDTLAEIHENEHFIILLRSKQRINYKYVCLCTGAFPKLIAQAEKHPQVIGIRDTDSVDKLIEKLSKSKRVLIVGNGGIASELVFKLANVQVHWVIKDKHITATFVDPGAAEFFQNALTQPNQPETISKRMRYSENSFKEAGAALGPDWYKNLLIQGAGEKDFMPKIQIHYECEIKTVQNSTDEFPLRVTLSNGEEIGCDLIVSATGVTPKHNYTTEGEFQVENDGIKVNEFMQTNLKDVYAAGDVCSANWELAKHWFQMKLWTQARQMGCYAAKSMCGHFRGEPVLQDFCFEMFAHSTRLFGYKVILLGLYNGQKLDNNYEILLRMTKNREYIKFVLENNKLQGAVLIGDTDLEEMCENLILNQLDLSPYGDDILNPDIDIEDYFD